MLSHVQIGIVIVDLLPSIWSPLTCYILLKWWDIFQFIAIVLKVNIGNIIFIPYNK